MWGKLKGKWKDEKRSEFGKRWEGMNKEIWLCECDDEICVCKESEIPENYLINQHTFGSTVKQEPRISVVDIYMKNERNILGIYRSKDIKYMRLKGVNAITDIRLNIIKIDKPRDVNFSFNLGIINL